MTFSIQTLLASDLPFMNSSPDGCIVKAKRREWKFFNKKVDSFHRMFVHSEGCIRFRPSFHDTSDGYKKSHARKVRLQLEDISTIRKACRQHFRKSRSKRRRCRHISSMVGKFIKASRVIDGSMEESKRPASTPQYATCKYPIEREAHERLKKGILGYKGNVVARPIKDSKLVCLSVDYLMPGAFYNKWRKKEKLSSLRSRLDEIVVQKGWRYICEDHITYWSEKCRYEEAGISRCEKVASTKKSSKACKQLSADIEENEDSLHWWSVGEAFVNAVLAAGLVFVVVKLIKGIVNLFGRIGGGPRGPGGNSITGDAGQAKGAENTETAGGVSSRMVAIEPGSSRLFTARDLIVSGAAYLNQPHVKVSIQRFKIENVGEKVALLRGRDGRLYSLPRMKLPASARVRSVVSVNVAALRPVPIRPRVRVPIRVGL